MSVIEKKSYPACLVTMTIDQRLYNNNNAFIYKMDRWRRGMDSRVEAPNYQVKVLGSQRSWISPLQHASPPVVLHSAVMIVTFVIKAGCGGRKSLVVQGCGLEIVSGT